MMIGEGEAEDFGDVLEEAYAAGVNDAMHDDIDDDEDEASRTKI